MDDHEIQRRTGRENARRAREVARCRVSFSQPIALRVDELVSGVKSAIGIKIFGDDLDVLKQKGDAVARVLGKCAARPT